MAREHLVLYFGNVRSEGECNRHHTLYRRSSLNLERVVIRLVAGKDKPVLSCSIRISGSG